MSHAVVPYMLQPPSGIAPAKAAWYESTQDKLNSNQSRSTRGCAHLLVIIQPSYVLGAKPGSLALVGSGDEGFESHTMSGMRKYSRIEAVLACLMC
eukprot:1190023-Prorocentrum_minimum.AAC.4